MSWNYRVVKKDDGYGIHEVYYNEADDICMISENQIAPYGTDFHELRGDVHKMEDAFGRPVLIYEEIEFSKD